MYSWEHPNWPNYTYSTHSLARKLETYHRQLGRLTGLVEGLSLNDKSSAIIDSMVTNGIDTSRIEGELLDRESLRSSIKQFLKLAPTPAGRSSQKEHGVAAMVVESRKTFADPLSHDYLHRLHAMVLDHVRDNDFVLKRISLGQYRSSPEPMQIVSGPIGFETVHYEAPPSEEVQGEMSAFIDWFNETGEEEGDGTTISGIERAAIAHLWFETIHPYDDGNGRVGRAIVDKALSQDAGYPVLANAASAMLANKREYYDKLHEASLTLDVQPWVEWFSDIVLEAQSRALDGINRVVSKARFYDAHSALAFNARQEKALNKMFATNPEGFGMTAKKYVNLTRCSKATATRDLAQLHEWGCLISEGQGRSVRYNLDLSANDLETLNLDLIDLDGALSSIAPLGNNTGRHRR